MSDLDRMFNFGVSGSKSASNSSGTFNRTTTPIAPPWTSDVVQGAAGRINSLLGVDPQSLVAGPNPLQQQAAWDASELDGYNGNFAHATDLTRDAAYTGWAQPFLAADTPFASGGKAYDYVGKYLNPYLAEVVDASAADFDANAGQVRAQQALDLAGSGAFGGSGAALTQSMTEGELARARASTLSGLRSQAYDSALGAAAGDAERATQARIGNAQLKLQDQANRFGFGLQANQQKLAAADQLAGIAAGLDVNRRANLATRAELGTMMRGVENEQLQAPVTTTQQIVAALSGLPLNLFIGQQEQGTQSSRSTTTTKGVEAGLKAPF
ncbi:MAG: hypothetical protein JNL41_01665 [Phenylobacterium sp.]|uniref:hypothetical protein n=1 Tax=Phenylobacterium sp. TaxID=1871053 RepID=UPI001A3CE891|nr:hypothetical protein [Phenylobacterium sp.]MBL8552955.1 hypothetical protein [Phenylobacterium sp.]